MSGCYAALKRMATPHPNHILQRNRKGLAMEWMPTVNDFMACVLQVRMDQDEEVKKLTQLRDSLRLLLQVEGKEVRLFRTIHLDLCTYKSCTLECIIMQTHGRSFSDFLVCICRNIWTERTRATATASTSRRVTSSMGLRNPASCSRRVTGV